VGICPLGIKPNAVNLSMSLLEVAAEEEIISSTSVNTSSSEPIPTSFRISFLLLGFLKTI
jgi:hypothetical protein